MGGGVRERPIEPGGGARVEPISREVLPGEVLGRRVVGLLGPYAEREASEPGFDGHAGLADEEVDEGRAGEALGRAFAALGFDLQRAGGVFVEGAGFEGAVPGGRAGARAGGQVVVGQGLVGVVSPGARRVRVVGDGAQIGAPPAGVAEPGFDPRAFDPGVPVVRVVGEGGVEEVRGAAVALVFEALVGVAVQRVDDVRAAALPDAGALEAGLRVRRRVRGHREARERLAKLGVERAPRLAGERLDGGAAIPGPHDGRAPAIEHPGDERAGDGVALRGVLSEKVDREEAADRGKRAEVEHGPRPLRAGQLVVVGRGRDGDAFDEAGVRPETASAGGDAERSAAEGAGDDVRDLVSEDGVRIAEELDVDFAAPGLGDRRVRGAGQRALLVDVVEDELGDAAAQAGSEACFVGGELLLAISEEERGVEATTESG